MTQNCFCGKNCITTKENIADKIADLNPCEKCEDITIKKFSPINELIDFNKLDSDYKKCECGKRPIDIVMSHILKIMIEEDFSTSRRISEKRFLRSLSTRASRSSVSCSFSAIGTRARSTL